MVKTQLLPSSYSVKYTFKGVTKTLTIHVIDIEKELVCFLKRNSACCHSFAKDKPCKSRMKNNIERTKTQMSFK